MRAHLVELADPAGASQLSSLIESKWLGSQCSQCKIDCVAFRGQPVPAHYDCACFIIDVYVCACHTPTIHHGAVSQQVSVPELRLRSGDE
jgi:hypothetical protein